MPMASSSSASSAAAASPSATSPRTGKSQVGEAVAMADASEATPNLASMRLAREQDQAARRKAQLKPDYNALYFRHQVPPTWTFGASGLGHRFNPGTKFSRSPPVPTHTRQ